MTTLDWVIVAFTAVVACYGFLQGFIVGALSLLGFGVGAFVGTRLGPALLPQGAKSPYAPLFGLAGALLAGGVLAMGLEGLGLRVRQSLRIPGLGAVDGLLGAVLTACVALGIVWIGGAVALQAPGTSGLRDEIQQSAILRRLNDILPPSGPILHALARFDPLPSIRGPEAHVPPPSRGVLADRRIRAAFSSVVRITGTACGLGIEGSGWAAGGGLVVTNAHVVAGESDTAVQVGGQGAYMEATPVAFDTHDDVAVLRVDGLEVRPLTLARAPAAGAAVAILGYPEDGPFDAQPGRLGATAVVASQDAYGRGPVRRSITSFRGVVRPGNSGGPVVDRAGHVAATVFAATVGGPLTGGFGVPNAVVRRELGAARAGHAVDTGPCAG